MSEEAPLDEFIEAESNSSGPETEDLARKTVCGIPPQDWTVARLGELVHVVSGNSLPTEYQNENGAEHPVYKVSDMNATGNQKYVSESSNWLSKADLEELNHTLYPEGTTILPKVGAALLTNKRRLLTEPSSFDNNVMGWVPDKINPEFLYYVSCMIDMEAVAQKGAVPSISKAIAKSLKLPFPPLPEQRKIATVLYTVDRAIEKTEGVIKQEERILNGTLNKLFTRGLDESGNLRPSPADSPESYQEAGRYFVPNEWDVNPLQNLCTENITYGIVQPGPHDKDGVPYINTEDMTDGNIPTEGLSKTSQEIAEQYSRSEIHTGELVITIRATIGAVDRVPSELDGANLTRGTARIVPGDRLDNSFLLWAIRSNVIQSELEARVKGTTFDEINLDQLGKIPVPYPTDLEEQTAIVDILSTMDSQIESEKSYLESLHRLKRGLMQDLLSGTVRTTDTNIEVSEKVA